MLSLQAKLHRSTYKKIYNYNITLIRFTQSLDSFKHRQKKELKLSHAAENKTYQTS